MRNYLVAIFVLASGLTPSAASAQEENLITYRLIDGARKAGLT